MGRIVGAAIVINGLVFLGAVGLVLFIRSLAGVWLYDSNFETFHEVLNERQQMGIIWSTEQLVDFIVFPLIATNVVWIVLVVTLLWRSRRSHGGRSLPIGEIPVEGASVVPGGTEQQQAKE